jgi:hypothetical protein
VGPTYPSIQWLPLVKRPQREVPSDMIKNAWNYIYPLQSKYGVVLNQGTEHNFCLYLLHFSSAVAIQIITIITSLAPFFYFPSRPHFPYPELR